MISEAGMMDTTFKKVMKWRKSSQKEFTQVWHDYVHKATQIILEKIFLYDSLESLTSVLLIKVKYSDNFMSYASEILENTPLTCNISKASGRITLQANENIMGFYVGYGAVYLTYTWILNINPSLALNITIENIQFASDYLECYWARLTVHNSESLDAPFTYCGHHTNFNIYPRYNDVNIAIYSYRGSIFNFFALFSIMIKNQIVNIKPSILNMDIYWIYVTENNYIFSYTFHITVIKIHYVFLQFSETVYFRYEIYDGPGVMSPNIRNSGHVYVMSSFQCTAVILAKRKLETDVELVNYTSKPVHFSHVFNISSTESSFTVHVPLRTCFKPLCAIFLFTDERFHINITLLEIIYKGPIGEKCKYGGLVTGEETVTDYKESLTICEFHGIEERHGMTFFSKNSSLILITFWYEHYSEISTTVQVSLTKCLAVQLDGCAVQQLCHSVFNMNNLTRCNSYLKYISQNHLLYYKNFHDWLDFVLFSLQEEECIVLQFRKRTASSGFLFYPQCSIQLQPSNGEQLQYRVKGSFSSFFYDIEKIKGKTQLFSDSVAYFGETDNFCFQSSKEATFKFICKKTRRRESEKSAVTILKQDYIHLITQKYVKNEYFYIWASQSPYSGSNPLRILIMLTLFSHSWIDVVVLKHEINRKMGSTLKDKFFTESISLPFILHEVKNLGRRWDHFILLKLDEKITNFHKLVFNVKIKSRFDGQGNGTELNWSSGFNFSHLRDFKLISLPGRVYEAVLNTSQMLMHRKSIFKNNSLNLIWLHEDFGDTYQSTHFSVDDCSRTKGFSSEPVSFGTCLNSSSPSLKKFTDCFDAMWYQYNIHKVKCLEYTLPKERNQQHVARYMIFTHEFHYMHTQIKIESYKMSWMEASNLCKDAGAMLPYFTSRQDLDQLIRLLKLSRDGFLLEGLFIGLVYNPTNKVNP